MKEYKLIKSELHMSNNLQKFEDKLNDYALKGWEVKEVHVVGDSANDFVAVLQRSKTAHL